MGQIFGNDCQYFIRRIIRGNESPSKIHNMLVFDVLISTFNDYLYCAGFRENRVSPFTGEEAREDKRHAAASKGRDSYYKTVQRVCAGAEYSDPAGSAVQCVMRVHWQATWQGNAPGGGESRTRIGTVVAKTPCVYPLF